MLQCGFVRSNFSLAMAKTPAARKGAVVSGKNLERVDGIEPTSSAWKAAALPLCYTRAETAEVLGERRSRFLSVVLIHRIRQGAWWGKKDSNLRSLRRGFTVPPLCHSGHSPSAPCRTHGPPVPPLIKRDETKAFGFFPPPGQGGG